MAKAKVYTNEGEPQDIGDLEADSLVIGGVNILTQLQNLQNQINSLNSRVSALE